MSDKIQSDRHLAEQIVEHLKAGVECAEKIITIIIGETNLQVVEQISAVSTSLEDCSTEFRSLVEHDADSIMELQEALETFDTALSVKRR